MTRAYSRALTGRDVNKLLECSNGEPWPALTAVIYEDISNSYLLTL